MGGATTAEVIEVPAVAPSRWSKKHIANIRHEPLTVEVGLGASDTMLDWIQDALTGGAQVFSGEVVSENSDYKISFFDAHISEVTFPALDGSSAEPAYLTVKIDPERTNSTQDAVAGPVPPATLTPWLSSNFRMTMEDLPCDRVAKINSFTFKQGVVTDGGGELPGKLEVPNLSFYVSLSDIGPWTQFQTSFLDRGGSEAAEIQGSIELLSPDLKKVLGTLEMRNIGLISLNALNKDEPDLFLVEMYVEVMEFKSGAARR